MSDPLAMMHDLLPLAKRVFSVACCTRMESLALLAQDLPCCIDIPGHVMTHGHDSSLLRRASRWMSLPEGPWGLWQARLLTDGQAVWTQCSVSSLWQPFRQLLKDPLIRYVPVTASLSDCSGHHALVGPVCTSKQDMILVDCNR